MAKNKRRNLKMLPIEKILYGGTILLVICFIVFTVFSKTTYSKYNIDAEQLKVAIADQEKKNDSLEMKVNELASLENINKVAANLGLEYNNANIKVVETDNE